MFGGATRYMNLRDNTNLHDREKMSGFQRGRSGSRPCLERRNSRFRLLTRVSASSTAATARDGVEHLQRLLWRAQTVAVTREAMMSEWRRQRRIGFWFDANVAW